MKEQKQFKRQVNAFSKNYGAAIGDVLIKKLTSHPLQNVTQNG